MRRHSNDNLVLSVESRLSCSSCGSHLRPELPLDRRLTSTWESESESRGAGASFRPGWLARISSSLGRVPRRSHGGIEMSGLQYSTRGRRDAVCNHFSCGVRASRTEKHRPAYGQDRS